MNLMYVEVSMLSLEDKMDFFFFFFLGHVEVPRLGVKSELQLPA